MIQKNEGREICGKYWKKGGHYQRIMGSDEEGKQSFNKGSIGKHKHKTNQGQHYKECRGGRHT